MSKLLEQELTKINKPKALPKEENPEDCPPCRMGAAIGLSVKLCKTLKETNPEVDCAKDYDLFVQESLAADALTDPQKAHEEKVAAADRYFNRMIEKVTPVDVEQSKNLLLLRDLMHGRDVSALLAKGQEMATKPPTETNMAYETATTTLKPIPLNVPLPSSVEKEEVLEEELSEEAEENEP